MASKERQLKVAITGDATDLEKALSKLDKSVANTSKEIEDIAKTTTKSSKDFSKGFDGVRDSADDTERRIVGFRDSLTGTQDVMKGLRDGDMVALSTGFADLASSVANLGADMLEWGKKALAGAKNVVAAHGASVAAKAKDVAATVAHKVASVASTVATTAQTAAQWALNAAMSANPIMLVVIGIGLLVAGFIVAWKHSETFREVVTAAFDAVVGAAMWAFNWVKDNWPLLLAIITGPIGLAVLAVVKNWDKIRDTAGAVVDAVVGFFTGIPDRLGDMIGKMAQFGTDLGRALVNSLIGIWNKADLRFPRVEVPSWVPGIGGKGFGGFDVFPDIKPLHTGGVFRAATPGGEGLALLRDGERVSTPGSGMGGVTIVVQGSMLSTERELVSILKRAQREGVVV